MIWTLIIKIIILLSAGEFKYVEGFLKEYSDLAETDRVVSNRRPLNYQSWTHS